MTERAQLDRAREPLPVMDRTAFIAAITAFLSNQEPAIVQAIRESLERELAAAGPVTLARLHARLTGTGIDWTYYPGDPLARRIHHVIAERLLHPDSRLEGREHVEAVAGKPVVIFGNHLSYSDANLLEVLLHRAGATELAARLTTVAGPKVYSSLERRFSSLCFGTIKTPQNRGVSSEDAVMDAREIVRAARRSIDSAHERLKQGDALLVFAEGTRSRSYGLQPMLAGVSRYLDGQDAWVLPVGIVGTEVMFPIEDDKLHPVPIIARAGQPIDATTLRDKAAGNRQLLMDAVGLAVAATLPPAYRGVYASGDGELAGARDLLAACGQTI